MPSLSNLKLSTMLLYNTMLLNKRHVISIKFILSTMLLCNTMLLNKRHANSIKFTLSTMILYNTMLPHMCRAIPVKSVYTISCKFNPYAVPVIFRLFNISSLISLSVVIKRHFPLGFQIVLTCKLSPLVYDAVSFGN